MKNKEVEKISKESELLVLSLYDSGLGTPSISKKLNIKISTAQRVLRQNKVKMRSNEEKGRIYSINHDYFNNIDSQEKAYWLGFFYADGYVSSNEKENISGISLAIKDINHIEKLKKCIDSDKPIGVYKNNSVYGSHDYCRLNISSKKIRSDLIRHGVTPKKTNTLLPPKDIPQELINHFIRGYFDGDGCFTMNKEKWRYAVKILGTEEFLSWVNEMFYENTGYKAVRFYKRHPEDIVSSLEVSGKNIAGKTLNYIYKNAEIFLERKHDKYCDFLSL